MSTLISLATGNGTVSEKTAEEAKEVAQQVAEEGFVLLKNDDSFLPLQNISKLNLFGWGGIQSRLWWFWFRWNKPAV